MSVPVDHGQIHLLAAIRDFFTRDGFMDVLTPPAVSNPGMETHLHPFRLASARDKTLTDFYLHTSPEFFMKKLLAEGLEKIFTISYCFRDEPNAIHHRPQFLMLEWYRAHTRYEKIMQDSEELIAHCLQYLQAHKIPIRSGLNFIHVEKATIREIFLQYLKFDILDFLDRESLTQKIKMDFRDIPLPAQHETLSWDDLYFLLFLNYIEPQLSSHPFIMLYEFPHHLSALSTLKESDPRVAERFEIYSYGIELCNAFNELTDLAQQKKRFHDEGLKKTQLYNYSLPSPEVLYEALERGLPPSAGIAMGVERLYLALTNSQYPFWSE